MTHTLEQRLRRLSVYQPDDIDDIVHAESNFYRNRVAVLINFVRLMGLAIFLFVVFPLNKDGNITVVQQVATSNGRYIFLVAVYLIAMIVMLYLLAYHRRHSWLLIVNAFVDAVLLFTIIISVQIQQGMDPLPVLFMVSVMASVLTLNAVQSMLFGVFCAVPVIIFISFYNMELQTNLLSLLKNEGVYDGMWSLFHGFSSDDISHTLTIATLFSSAIVLLGYFSAKAQENTIRARINQYFVNNLYKLNESIIEEMGSGLMVVNSNGLVVSLNRKAREMLALDDLTGSSLLLSALSPAISRRFQKWLHLQVDEYEIVELISGNYSLSFISLDQSPDSELTLLMMENVEVHYERVRETRLASLGRLSAGIAHEIRNPLSAIQQAGQLLAEHASGDTLASRLTEKIERNGRRINGIISEVMRLFDNQPRTPELFPLNPFIERVRMEAEDYSELANVGISLDLAATKNSAVMFSPDAMREIISNLLLNARKHNPNILLALHLSTKISEDKQSIYLDISDNGCGISEEERDKVFEPFYSLRNSTGLGLYLVREMCNANHARIILVNRGLGACFRIIMRNYPLTTVPLMNRLDT
ncbi:hypothetical protein KRX19_05855 [Cardiobacteriaceae bacterium TAE3-ERU3]|nr:hypothetical protein [Cardiobacteriaceae bacterium TAE3-ERU3]